MPTGIPYAPTHGDLTFENILVSHTKELYFIDFLDSFIDSPYIDMGKINQELHLYWSARHSNPSAALLIKYEKLAKMFKAYCASNNVDKYTLAYFSIITLLRILPYTDNKIEIDLIKQNIEKWQKELQ
jgi:thiamine kinase-like enzyme